MHAMTKTTALETLTQHAKLLEPLLVSHGFGFKIAATGKGSGGYFAAGEFTRGDRRLELHFRYSLGIVTYHLGPSSMDHAEYMRSVLGKQYASHYPGFSSDPLDAFRDLLRDLEEHCGEFLEGSDDLLRNRIEAASKFRNEQPHLPE